MLPDLPPIWLAPLAGGYARGVANRVTRDLDGLELPAFPQPNAASRPRRRAARTPGSAAALVAALAKGWRA